jgi:hypothetical protein
VGRNRKNDKLGEPAVKTFLSALLALIVINTVAVSANAFDAKTFYQQQERYHY